MKVIKEISLTGFDFWSGAVDNANKLTYEELGQLTTQLEELYPEGITDTDINDLMWFDFATVCEWLGLEYDEETDEIKRG